MPSKPPRRIEPKFTPYQPGEPVPYWQRASNFIKASAAHALNGFHKADPETVKMRFSICETCEIYEAKGEKSGVCKHSKCGCNIKDVGILGINKLTWAEQACPLGKWLPVECTVVDE